MTTYPSPEKNSLGLMASAADLQYFFEVASVLNVSRAAERLGLTQPSLTQSLQRLEHALGETVFIRHKRGVTLTPAGKQLLVHTRSLLQQWSDIKSKAKASMNAITGSFTIGCHSSVALFTLKEFLPKILENRHLEIHLVHDLSRRITERVISSEIDIGIVVNPVKHPDLILQRIMNDEVTLWHNLSVAQKSRADREGYTLISDPSLLQTQALLKKIQSDKIPIARTMHTSDLEVAANLTAYGCGIGILPTNVAKGAPKPLTKLVKAPIFKDEICIAIRVENKRIAAIQYICDVIKKGF